MNESNPTISGMDFGLLNSKHVKIEMYRINLILAAFNVANELLTFLTWEILMIFTAFLKLFTPILLHFQWKRVWHSVLLLWLVPDLPLKDLIKMNISSIRALTASPLCTYWCRYQCRNYVTIIEPPSKDGLSKTFVDATVDQYKTASIERSVR